MPRATRRGPRSGDPMLLREPRRLHLQAGAPARARLPVRARGEARGGAALPPRVPGVPGVRPVLVRRRGRAGGGNQVTRLALALALVALNAADAALTWRLMQRDFAEAN